VPIYCPGCATEALDQVRYCKKCGTSLLGVKDAMHAREPEKPFEWSKTWIAEMLLSEEERSRRRVALELTGRDEDLVAAEIKRVDDLQNEIKNGIITVFSGVGAAIFMYIFMGTIASAQDDPKAAMILGSLWVAGIIPILVGMGMLVNAFFVTRRFAAKRRDLIESALGAAGSTRGASSHSTGELLGLDAPPMEVPSVTEHTTRHLEEPSSVPRPERHRE
jgi:hypothetical protein